jgi:DNA-binding response OmpR family regulator
VSNDITVGPVRLNLASRRCFVGDDEVTLTTREFAVFEYLVGRLDEVVPKRDILANVWDDAYEGAENVVEVHVHALRRKLGVDVIETIRGGGYRVKAH